MTKRIVVESGAYNCGNMGDVAMMMAAAGRLAELWPQAEIGVLTAQPEKLARFCPDAVPIDVEARRTWLSGRSLIARVRRRLPPRAAAFVQRLEEELWLRCPRVTELWIVFRAWALGKAIPPSPSRFRKRLTGADLLVVNGMGGLTDAFREEACAILDTLKAVSWAGVPIAAFGQGIGPITDPELLAKAREVLPRLKLIGLREGRMGLPLLVSLGVPSEIIHVTGDDAIELAYQLRPASLGDAIGINLRLADYAETDDETVAKLREPLRRIAQALNSSLIPVPISFHLVRDSDVEAIGKLLEGQSQSSQAAIESPEDVIRQIGKCRVVVTGSYHAGVFALAQGIPVVGPCRSRVMITARDRNSPACMPADPPP